MGVAARTGLLAAVVWSLACASASKGADGERSVVATPKQVAVTVTFRERIMVPSGSELDVRIVDVSKGDSAATTVAQQKKKISGGPPFRVALEIPPELYIDSSRYHARAEILRPDSSTMFRTRQGVPVLTFGARDSVEVVVGIAQ